MPGQYVGDGLHERLLRLPDGRAMRTVRGGDRGPVVVFESGLGEAAGSWVAVQRMLAPVARTLAYDRAGLGGSDASRLPRTLEHMATDALGVLDAAGIDEPAILVGHSWGGPLVREIARRASDRVRGLVLVDPTFAVVIGSIWMRGVESMYARWEAAARLGGRRWLLRQFRDGRWPELSDAELEIVLADRMRAAELRTSRRELRELTAARAQVAALEAQAAPVPLRLLIGLRRPVPQRDLVVEEAERVAALGPAGRAIAIEGVGHCIAQEAPARTATEIRVFMEDLA